MKQKSYRCCPKIIAQPNDAIYEWRGIN